MASSGEGVDFRFIAAHACGWESWLSADGALLWTSAAGRDLAQVSEAECRAMHDFPLPLIDERDRAGVAQSLREAAAGREATPVRVRLLGREGTRRWVAVACRAARADDGGVGGLLVSIRDLSEDLMQPIQVGFQEALAHLTRSGLLTSGSLPDAFRIITETAADVLDLPRVGIWLMSEERSQIECRDMFERPQRRHSSGQTVERGPFPRYFAALESDRAIVAERARHDLRTAELTASYLEPFGIESMLDAPIVLGGRAVGVLCHEHTGTVRSWNAAEIGFAASLADLAAIALEAAHRHALDERQRQLASILEASPDFVGTSDMNGVPTYINPAGRQLVGLGVQASLRDWSVTDLYTDRARRQRDEVSVPTALKEGIWSGESEFLTCDREPFPVAQVLIAHKDDQGRLRYLSTVARDLRPWKAAQAALQERERFLATLVGNLPGVAYRRRNAPGWPMEYISEGCLELTGYPAEAILAAQPYYNDIVHPEDHDKVYAEVESALVQRRPFKIEYRIRRADGNEIWVWSKGRGIYDEAGTLIAREGFIGDITERVQAQIELERLNADLEARVAERTARLAEVNQQLESFAYSVSHDLKAPLRGIDGYSRLLIEDYDDKLDDDGRAFLGNIRTASQRMNQLIDDLLTYSRLERRELSSVSVDLAILIERLFEELQVEEGEVRLVSDLAGTVVQADLDALTQIMRNLIDNALKFSRESRPPRVEVSATSEPDRVTLCVSDNGVGFDMRYHDRIFDIFQRLHRAEEYPGTGVGLAIVRKAAERMRGRVWAESAPGAGARFYLELPR